MIFRALACDYDGTLASEDQLVPDGDRIGGDLPDLRFEQSPGIVDGPGVELRQAPAASLVEAQGVDVVVRGNEPGARDA